MSENEQRLRRVVSAVLGVSAEAVNDALSPDVTDTWDSLNHINLVAALEQEFGVLMPAESLTNAQSVGGLKAQLTRHGVTF
jgi:acyl carrier protein